jgi:hypothetical protein
MVVEATQHGEVGQGVGAFVGSVFDVVHLEVAAACAAGNLAAMFVALFDFAALLATNNALAVPEMLGVAVPVSEHDVDVGVAQHPQRRVDGDPDWLVQAVAVAVDLAAAVTTTQGCLAEVQIGEVTSCRARLV